jgi:ketosteroid isomerase-like protein
VQGEIVSQSDPASNAALVRRYVAAVNAGDLDAVEELFARDYVNHLPSGPATGPRAMREFVAEVREWLTALDVTVDELIADGDQVGVRLTLRGTPADAGREVTLREIQIYRIAEGRIAERWFVVDMTDLQA